jgi:hypothetical protein
MKSAYHSLILIMLVIIGISCCMSVSPAMGDERPLSIASGLQDQTGVAVTIYNVNLGLVKDQRKITLNKGMGELRFMDVASQIIPTSVSIRSLVDPKSLQVLEQNY